jgi:hypothetical protein
MYHIPYSYEQELKEQVEQRLAAIERIHRADVMDKARRGAQRTLISRVGELLIRLGTRLEQSDRTLEQINGASVAPQQPVAAPHAGKAPAGP